MKFSATILALIGTSVVVNGRVMSKQSLAQTAATLTKSAPSPLNLDILWAPDGSIIEEVTDAFGNTYHHEETYWVFHDLATDSTTKVFEDHVEQDHADGSSIWYDFAGETKFTDADGNAWKSHPDGSEDYFAADGDHVFTSANGLFQHYTQMMPDQSTDCYYY